MEMLLGVWASIGILAALIASSKGAPGIEIFIDFILGPIGLLAALILKNVIRECPYCANKIKKKASICEHCKKEVEPVK